MRPVSFSMHVFQMKSHNLIEVIGKKKQTLSNLLNLAIMYKSFQKYNDRIGLEKSSFKDETILNPH